MWKRTLIPAVLGIVLLGHCLANMDWITIHIFHPPMAPSIGQVMDKHPRTKDINAGKKVFFYRVTIQGTQSPFCGGEALVEKALFHKLKHKDQLSIHVLDDVCYLSQDIRWGKWFRLYYQCSFMGGFIGLALLGYVLWEIRRKQQTPDNNTNGSL